MTVAGPRPERAVASEAAVAEHLRRVRGDGRAVLTRSQVRYVAYLLGLVSLWAVVPAVGAVRALLAPVPVVAGLLSAYKGRPPLILAVSGDDHGPMALLGWYLVGPLTSLCLLWPLGLLTASSDALVLVLSALLTGAGTSALGLTAVARRARRLDADQ